MKKLGLVFFICLLVGLDQLSKWWVVSNIKLGEIRSFIPHVFSLTYLQNRGAAFSILQNQQWFFALMTLLVLGGAVYYLLGHLNGSVWLLSGLVLVIAGGLGNFIDRVRLGYVVDMVHLDFVNFAIFNVADACLSVGVLLLVIALWKEEAKNENHH
ncbi:signal peptidase II [Streptococcus ferus]|uniref:signal peptidase II n=1 Tax=Streptococcus ferus TaxID=1345 RepID=UPI0035A1B355